MQQHHQQHVRRQQQSFDGLCGFDQMEVSRRVCSTYLLLALAPCAVSASQCVHTVPPA